MDMIDIGDLPQGKRLERYFARSVGAGFSAAQEGGRTTVDLFDEIGWFGVTADAFMQRLRLIGGDILLRINSPGGDVFDGIAIHNALKAHDGHVRVEIVGIAASIASIIAMAGDEIHMAENGFMMIHNAWSVVRGNRHDMGDRAAMLAKIDDALARTYAANTKTGIREIKKWMDDETWLTAKEALDAGFATSVGDPSVTAKARFDLSPYDKVPTALRWDGDDGDSLPETKRDLERYLTREAGLPRSKARALCAVIEMPSEAKREAGGEDFTSIANALREARAKFH